MKRRITALLAAALVFGLSACGADPAQGNSLDSDRTFIHYGQMTQVCATQDTIYYAGGQLIHYYDKTTGLSGILCGKAECEHSTATDSTCNAYINSISNDLHLYNGRLYWTRSKGASRIDICSMALDGADHRTERTMGSEIFSSTHGVNATIFHRGYAYTYVKNYTIRDGQEFASLDMAAVPLDPEQQARLLFSEELSPIADRWSPYVAMQAWGDDVYVLTSWVADVPGAEEAAVPQFYDFRIYRYNAVEQQLEILYQNDRSPLTYVVEMWVMEDGIVFSGQEWQQGDSVSGLFRFDKASGAVTRLFDTDGAVKLAQDMAISSRFSYEQANPTNPWGMTFALQDREINGELSVTIQNFAGEPLLQDTYSLNGLYNIPIYYGHDDRYAYFLSDEGYGDQEGITNYMTLLGVALDGSGLQVLGMQEEYYRYPGIHGSSESVRYLDDGTKIEVKDGKKITVTPPDGGEVVTMTVEELLANGYRP